MLLKKLEIFGFKSFADKAEFVFEPGITCIVGPNGCGKSNIVDAIKWSLGEQSAKSLRGDQMADVIFNGAEGRSPHNYAEVSLIFDNESRLLHSEYPEILITRRLNRAGESEYLINRTPCRLKDIRDLFLDTGVGVQAYSIVEQGRIDSLLSANAVDRRTVFEEAAGISKYKIRRAEAIRKLERVEANLVRLHDIVEEVSRQLRSTKRQASIARRYREYTVRIRDMRVALSAYQYNKIKERETEAKRRCDELDSRISAENAKAEELSASTTQTETKLLDLEHAISDARSQLAELKGKTTTTEEEIRHNTEFIRELRASEEQLVARRDACRNRIGELKRQLEDSRRALADASREHDEASAQLDSLRETRRTLDAGHRENEGRLADRKADVVDLLQRESKVANELSSLDTESRLLSTRADRMRTTQQTLTHEHRQLAGRAGHIENQINRNNSVLEDHSTRLRETGQQLAAVASSLQNRRAQAARVSAALTAKRSQAELLEQQEAAMEGVREGVKNLVSAAREGAVAGIVGPIADLIEVDVQHTAAIESALGERAQWLLTQTSAATLEAVAWLKQRGTGRATLISLEALAQRPVQGRAPVESDNVTGRASDLVRCDERHRSVVDMLLGDVLVARDLDSAMALSMNGGRDSRVVTPGGELVEPHGVVTGGAKTEGIISRRSELRALHERIVALQTSLDSINDDIRHEEFVVEDLELRRESARTELDSCNMTRNELLAEQKRNDRRLDEILEEIRLNRSELAEIESELAAKETRRGELRASLEQIGADRETASAEIARLERELEQSAAQLADNAEALTAARVRLAQLAEKRDSARRDAERLEKEQAEAEKEEASTSAQSETCTRRIGETETALAQAREKLTGLKSQCEKQDVLVGEKEGERDGVSKSLELLRAQTAEIRTRLNSLREEHEEARLALNQAQSGASAIVEKIRDDYEIDLVEKLPEFEEADIDCEMLPASIEELKEKVQRMGNVNLSALDELEELEQRSSFLGVQEGDLLGAKTKLQDVIRTVNRESRTRFEQTFGVIREHFKTTFRQLFGGGKADITLEEGQDILEAGIEITARPPGKEMRTITLLSGGEKVLTAIAVLFALFKARPSPFAILDEVDAALDDTNIGRFLMLLRQFSERSQFVIISHNKQTMAAANILYGITMQQTGVSKKMAVRMEELESQVA